jgi:hypothetical protein
MKMTTVTAALTLITLMATQAQAACYVCDKQAWDALHPYAKEGFVAGALAGATQISTIPGNPADVAKADLSICVANMNLGSGDMVDVVETQFRDLANWSLSPDAVLMTGLEAVCASQIDATRAARGDAPILR